MSHKRQLLSVITHRAREKQNYCQEKSVVQYWGDFLANRPGRYTREYIPDLMREAFST